ncbi:MAG: hypothetical protein ACSHX6_15835 [Akkermansiaceae bacterium]
MNLGKHISHYFEQEYGPFLSICDLNEDETQQIINREKQAVTGFNRFSYGSAFFEFRQLADDLLIELYQKKFQIEPNRRPYYAVLGDADVVGGLYRDPYKIHIPLNALESHEVTFMVPDHFHLVGMSEIEVEQSFGVQIPSDYDEDKYPYFGKLLTYSELKEKYEEFKIGEYLENNKKKNHWYRYIEAQIWVKPEELIARFTDQIEVYPEPWTHGYITYLQNYKSC